MVDIYRHYIGHYYCHVQCKLFHSVDGCTISPLLRMSVKCYQATRRHILEVTNPHGYERENVKIRVPILICVTGSMSSFVSL
jgi:hypothetical protein